VKIPAIRKRLHELADELGCDELRRLAEATRRKPPLRVAPRTSKAVLTDDQKREIERLADTFVHMPMREIAQRTGTDQGRVSEHLNKRARQLQRRPNLELMT
jgi:hypothetical protein